MTDRSRNDDGEGERGSAISLGDVVSAARRRIKLIAIISIALTVSAALVIWLLPNRYEAVASVQIDQRNKEIVNIKGVIS
ncbi:MAG: Wzz/FepE/Etk N-terminal domain-containing protein, partial [Hyphomicrobium sp.]